MERCHGRGIDLPVIPGVMPITNHDALVRFSNACGAEIPRWLDRQLADRSADEDNLRLFGIDVVTRLCERLITAGAPSFHFYTLNRWGATTQICRNLGLG